MSARTVICRLAASSAIGLLVGVLAATGPRRPAPSASRGACFSSLRLLRHAIAAFEGLHGSLPGGTVTAGARDHRSGDPTPALLARQLTEPRDRHGAPDPRGPYPGLLSEVPVNPYTGSSALVVPPDGADAVAFAAASPAGWAYLARPGHDAWGALPAGLVLPCGRDGTASPPAQVPSVQQIAFEIEDFRRWR